MWGLLVTLDNHPIRIDPWGPTGHYMWTKANMSSSVLSLSLNNMPSHQWSWDRRALGWRVWSNVLAADSSSSTAKRHDTALLSASQSLLKAPKLRDRQRVLISFSSSFWESEVWTRDTKTPSNTSTFWLGKACMHLITSLRCHTKALQVNINIQVPDPTYSILIISKSWTETLEIMIRSFSRH